MENSNIESAGKKAGLQATKYIPVALATFGFTVLFACVVFYQLPTYRGYLVDEDSLVENLSAAFYLLAFGLAAFLRSGRKSDKKFLTLVAAFGLLGFLDELSFGQRIFGFSEFGRIAGVGMDAAHDFFRVAYNVISIDLGWHAALLAGVGIVLLILFCCSLYGWSRLRDQTATIFRG